MTIRPPKVDPTDDTPRAQLYRSLHPGSGYCFRCGMPWKIVIPHSTSYTEAKGCFPLCQGCWTELQVPEARIEYYKMLIDVWEAEGMPSSEADKRAIQKAVANGG